MLCDWEGNRRSGHVSRTQVVYPPTSSTANRGDEHPTYAPDGARPGFFGNIIVVNLCLVPIT